MPPEPHDLPGPGGDASRPAVAQRTAEILGSRRAEIDRVLVPLIVGGLVTGGLIDAIYRRLLSGTIGEMAVLIVLGGLTYSGALFRLWLAADRPVGSESEVQLYGKLADRVRSRTGSPSAVERETRS